MTCRLDYYNVLLSGISGGLIQRLQSVQNAAAWLVTDALRRDHITPVLRQLHWLPVKQTIDFKLAVLVYKSLHGTCRTTVNSSRTWGIDILCLNRRLHVCRPTDTVTDWRQEFLCSRTAAIELPTDRDPEERHYYVRTL